MVAYASKKTRRVVGLLLVVVILFPGIAAVAQAVVLGTNGAS